MASLPLHHQPLGQQPQSSRPVDELPRRREFLRLTALRRRVSGSTRHVRKCTAQVSEEKTSASSESSVKPSAATSPFAGKKISSLLAARRSQFEEPPAVESTAAPPPSDSTADSASPPSPTSFASSPSPSPSPTSTLTPPPSQAQGQNPSPLSPTIASLLKGSPSSPSGAAKPASPFARSSSVNAVPAGTARPVVSFKKRTVLEALKAEGGMKGGPPGGSVGQPGAPANIFVDEVRSKEQIEAEKFRFEVSSGQILLALSFFASSIIMMGTVYLVWKLGAIHYNEY